MHQKDKKNYVLDCIRCFACLMVVSMHAPLPEGATGNGTFLATLSYFTAPCIGLFFMVSGALLLPVRTGTRAFLKRRLSKVVFPTLFWSLFYLVCADLMQDQPVYWIKAIGSLPFSAQGNSVLWFMYTLIGLYLLAPILSRWLDAVSRKEVEFYLGLWGISLCYPLLCMFVDCNRGNTGILYYFTGYAGYFVLGYYLKKYPYRISWKLILPLFIISIIAPVICKLSGWEVDFYDLFWYLSVFVVVQCIGWYLLVEWIVKFCFSVATEIPLFSLLSRLSFGIYLIHIFIMRYLLWNWEFIRLINSYILQTIAISILTFVLSAILCYLISFLPAAHYIIGYKHSK